MLQSDVFSFAVVLHELFHRYVISASLDNADQMEKYAQQVRDSV